MRWLGIAIWCKPGSGKTAHEASGELTCKQKPSCLHTAQHGEADAAYNEGRGGSDTAHQKYRGLARAYLTLAVHSVYTACRRGKPAQKPAEQRGRGPATADAQRPGHGNEGNAEKRMPVGFAAAAHTKPERGTERELPSRSIAACRAQLPAWQCRAVPASAPYTV